MRSLQELEFVKKQAWPRVKAWLEHPVRPVTWAPPDDDDEARRLLWELQVSLGSPLGAVVRHTNGLSIDDGWIRVLGAGPYGLGQWLERAKGRGLLVVAYDACGGFYALDVGGLGTGHNKVAWLDPETLDWEPTGLGYGAFLHRILLGDISSRYQHLRWRGWHGDVMGLPPNMVVSMKPPLWMKGPPPEQRQHYNVYVDQLWRHIAKLAKTLGRPWAKLLQEA